MISSEASSIASLASGRPLGRLAMPVAHQPGQERVVVLAGVVGVLELLVADRGLESLDQRRGHGLADAELHEQPDHQRGEIDRQQQQESADRSRGPDRQAQQVLGRRGGRPGAGGVVGVWHCHWPPGRRALRGGCRLILGGAASLAASVGLAGRLLGPEPGELSRAQPCQQAAKHRAARANAGPRSRPGREERAAASNVSPPTERDRVVIAARRRIIHPGGHAQTSGHQDTKRNRDR